MPHQGSHRAQITTAPTVKCPLTPWCTVCLRRYLASRGRDAQMAARLLAAIDGDKDGLIDRADMRNAMTWANTADADAFGLPQFGGTEGTADTNRALGGAYNTRGRSNAER